MTDSGLELGQLGPVDFPTLGWEVISWIETFLVHGPGDIQGQPIELDDEMALFVCHAYRLGDDGRRAVRRAVLSRAKGRAKSEMAAMIACAEALGPVRFDGWTADGNPVGRSVVAPLVSCFATEETQAGNTYDNVVYMLREGEAFREYEFRDPDIGLTRVNLPAAIGGGSIGPQSSGAASKDGGKETFVVFDETHLYVQPALKRLFATVGRNLGKRKAAEPWRLETSTMFAAGEQSVAEETHAYALKCAETGRNEGLLFDHREGPWVEDLQHDDEALRAAIIHTYGDAAAWIDVDRIMQEIRDPQSSEEDSRRYWLNQATRTADSWLDRRHWDAVGAPDELADGELITLGFDGALFDDSTALIACRVDDGKLFTLPRAGGDGVSIWERPEGIRGEGWQTPESEVDATLAEAMRRYQVAFLYGDPPYWQDSLARWSKEWPETIVEWWTNRDRQMVAAVERLETAVRAAVQGGARGIHAGDPVLARHVGNARRKTVRGGIILRKEAPKSPKKIDAAMAAILAYEARADALTAGIKKKRKKFASASF
jgi:hypothetical protein